MDVTARMMSMMVALAGAANVAMAPVPLMPWKSGNDGPAR
jgi:hypothetical protein